MAKQDGPEFDVPDMTCDGCAKAITNAVQRAIPGAGVVVDLAAKRVRVSGTEAADKAEAAIADAGFTPALRARVAALVLALGLMAAPAFAQTTPAPAAAPPPAPATPAPATPAPAAPMAPMSGHHGPAHAQGTRTSPAGKPTPATVEYRKAMRTMHRDMAIIYSNDADKDFVAGMIPHHQGALDMAKTELKYGKDPELRQLAQQIVDGQEKEIALMRAWQAKQPK